MTITFPLTMPSSNFRRLTIRANTVVGVTRSEFTLQTQVYKFTGQAWIAEVTLPILEREEAEAWTAFLLKLNGPFGTFMLGDPTCATPRGVASGTPLIKGAGQQGQILITDGWTINTTNVLKAGDYIQISNELYKVLNDASSNGSGEATLDIFPILRQSYADNLGITTSSPKGKFRLIQDDVPIYNVNADHTYEIGFTAVEAIS